MSGDRPVVELLATTGGTVARLVEAVEVLSSVTPGKLALIGGLAVACRLATVHRPTRDVDAVTERSENRSGVGELLVAHHGATSSRPGRFDLHGTKIELIETEPLPVSLSGLSTEQRLFLLAHRWALESATPLTIRAGRSQATLPVATGAALIAMKLHAVEDRSEDAKRASDVYDMYRLLMADGSGEIAPAIATAPGGLSELVAVSATRFLVAEAARSARWLRAYADVDAQVSADELRLVGRDLRDGLARHRQGD